MYRGYEIKMDARNLVVKKRIEKTDVGKRRAEVEKRTKRKN